MADETIFGNDPPTTVTFVAKRIQSAWSSELDREFQIGMPFYTRLAIGDSFDTTSSIIRWSKV